MGGVLIAWVWFLKSQLLLLSAHSWQVVPIWLAISIPIATLYFIGLGSSWAVLLRSMSATPNAVTVFQGARIWQLSMFSRYIPGNIWHVLSRALLAEQIPAPRSLVIASATIEQLITLLGALLVVPLALPQLGSRVLGMTGVPVTVIIITTLAAGLLLVHPQLLGRLFNLIGARLRRPEIAWNYTYRSMIGLLSLYAMTTIIAGFSLVAIVVGLGSFEIAHIPFIIGSAALAWIIGYMSIVTPSGLGVREGVLASLLALILPLPIAVAASLLFRISSTIGESLALVILWIAGRRASSRR